MEEEQYRKALSLGRWASSDNARVLRHLVSRCPRCSRRVWSVAERSSEGLDQELLVRNALRSPDEVPVLLVLGRFAAFVRATGSDAFLPFVIRRLLRAVAEKGSWGFLLKWLLIEECRLLAASSRETGESRWCHLAGSLRRLPSREPKLDGQLEALAQAWVTCSRAGNRDPAGALERLEKTAHQLDHPALRGELFEALGETYQRLDKPRLAIAVFRRAMDSLEHFRIPGTQVEARGRRAETRVRIALSHLLQGELRAAMTRLREAEASIPHGSDPVLRFVIRRYTSMAADGFHEVPATDAISPYFLAEWPLVGSELLEGAGEVRRN